MTTITTETEDAARAALTAPAPSFTLPAHVLRDLLVGTLLAASREYTMPKLCTVHLAWDADRGEGFDGTLAATATDRYRMNEGRVRVVMSAPGTALVDRRDAEALVKSLPKPAKVAGLDADARCYLDGRALVVEHDGNVRRLPLVDAEYPKVGTLWPDPGNAGSVSDVAMNPALVADVAKVPLGRKGLTYWRWTFFVGPHGTKPVLAEPAPGSEHDRITWRALVMPAKLPGASS